MHYVVSMTTPTTANPHGQRLRDFRIAAGLTLDEAWADLRHLLPKRSAPSKSTLQRMEAGAAEAKWDGIVVMGLAKLYRCRISDLSPMVAAEFDEVSELLSSSSPWITTPGQLSLLAA